MPDIVAGGSARGLSFRIEWERGHTQAAVGSLSLAVNEVPALDPAIGSRLDLTRLLEFLVEHWNPFVLEHGYPYGVTPPQPSFFHRFIANARTDWASDRTLRAARVRRFEQDHNVLSWLGEHGPVLWAVREGNLMVLQANDLVIRWSYYDVIRTLAELGDAIAKRLSHYQKRSDLQAIWARREDADDMTSLSLSLGIPMSEAQLLVDKQIVNKPANRNELLRDLDEVRAAARMLSPYVDVDDLAVIVAGIAEVGKAECLDLDELSDEAITLVLSRSTLEPFKQGHELALWFRDKLGLSDLGTTVDPQAIIKGWGVSILHKQFAKQIEAISVWGPRHGPAVLLNTDGLRYTKTSGTTLLGGGVRATLAHEMCHLLVDRGTNLPVVEVLGGSTPRVLEQRANAFGAELLLPRHFAIQVYRASSGCYEALTALTQTYKVTKTLAALQLLNYHDAHPGSLREEDAITYAHIAGI